MKIKIGDIEVETEKKFTKKEISNELFEFICKAAQNLSEGQREDLISLLSE